ncbi:telomere repeat-binding factor 1-like isoform X2 [Amaranthus tricolor]|uniref:telomere repeat-binding factor 1-like isoform X2 n=1 Tax=Amaranthus tricolor TaxID=29722 RepID=UPI00258B2D64|nr:telomere repeat-binding factor 1-like isoform X2 [Amaranthus tricolor]
MGLGSGVLLLKILCLVESCIYALMRILRKKSGVKHKRVPMQSTTVKQEENVSSASDVPQNEEMPDIKPHARISIPSERSIERLDRLILEAVANSKNPGGSNETAIASYIEDQCWTPPDFKHVLSANMKYLISSGKLVKIDEELANMSSVTPQEAAAAAYRAVAEAEAAMAEAEEASREADEAEAYAKAAQAFVDAATKMLRGRSIPKMLMESIV